MAHLPDYNNISEKRLFITVTQPDTNIQFTSETKGVFGLHITEISINGVPTTNGVPNYLFYNLQILGPNDDIKWIRSDQGSGIAIALTNNFTHQQYNTPLEIFGHVLPPKLHKPIDYLRIYLTDPNGRPAIFSQMCIWLVIRLSPM